MKRSLFFSIIFIAILGLAKAQFSTIFNFANAATGKLPWASFVSDGTFLYGMTSEGGANNYGTIFKIKPDGTGYQKLLDFDETTSGRNPMGSLILEAGSLYGMSSQGGANGVGTLFKIKTDGSAFSKLLDFNSASSGSYPEGSLFSDGTFLYGMTRMGGSTNYGTIFKIKPDGTGFVMLHDFNDPAQARNPYGSLISDGTFLYGMSRYGGSSSSFCTSDGCGIIFKIMPDGSGYSKIQDFSNDNIHGYGPQGDLVYDGTFLYGTTNQGGTSGLGTVFKVRPDGSQYSKLLDFTSTNGTFPNASLIYDGTFLYGTTYSGGANGAGTIMKIKPDGSGSAVMHSFDGAANGLNPFGSLFLHAGSLYGMTAYGGSGCPGQMGPSGCGIIFKYQLAPTGIEKNSVNSFMEVSPNPSSGVFKVNVESVQGTLSIRDLLGNYVVNRKPIVKGNMTIDLSDMPKGIYFLEAIHNGQTTIKKIVVE
jgi:uncharacterized repeat protein (TIGR03803 family)